MALTKLNNQSLTAVTAAGIPTLASANMPTGSVLQVKQTVSGSPITVNASTNSTAYENVLSVNITPVSANSKILVRSLICVGTAWWNNRPKIAIARDSTQISTNPNEIWPFQYGADSSNSPNEMLNLSLEVLDSPSTTSQITYHLQSASQGSNYEVFFNRPWSGSQKGQTSIVVMEIAG